MAFLPKLIARFKIKLRVLAALLLSSLLFASLVAAQEQGKNSEQQLLDESEYRSTMEEIVVVGKEPEWRKLEQKEPWRPDKFSLPTNTAKSRIEWLPEYTKDDRDNYNSVRDRTGEKAEFQLFNWKF